MRKKIKSYMTKSYRNNFIQLIFNTPRSLRSDILSGLTVALALVPEAVAFSFVANVDPRVGLYAAFMMGLVTAICGGRPGMISGATGAVAVIFAPLIIAQGHVGGMNSALAYLFAAVILMGVIQILFGIFRFGKFIRLMPHPVMLGFVNGLAIIICKAQFSQFYVGVGENAHLLASKPLAIMIVLIVITMAISFFLPKFTKILPGNLVAIIVVTLISIFLRNNGFEVRTVIDFVKNMDSSITTIAASLPSFHIPGIPFTLNALKVILPYAFLAAIVGLTESLMTLTLIDELTETRGRGNRECIGQGLANIVNGFFGGMGGCAMIGQSMINIRGGGRSRLSGITAAVCLLAFLIWFAPLIEMIPLAALVGVMFMVVIATFEWTSFRVIWKIPKSDAFVIIVVSVVTVLFDLAIAVLVGIVISAIVYAWENGKKIHATAGYDGESRKIYKLEGALFFGSVASFKELFDYQNDPEDIIIDFENSRVCDHSGLEALNNVTERFAKLNKKLHLLNLSKECESLIKKADNIVEISVIDSLEWHLAEDSLA
jgi:sulfate permease, SulP family